MQYMLLIYDDEKLWSGLSEAERGSIMQEYFTFNVRLSATDLVEVVLLTMIVGVVLCGATSFLTLRRYLRV